MPPKPSPGSPSTPARLPYNPNDDYDPHVHRNLPKPTNFWETLIHLLKSSLGTGILAMPQGFARSGLITGIIATVVVGIIVTHCLHVLLRSQYLACKRRHVALVPYTTAMAVSVEEGPPKIAKLARPSAVMVDLFLVTYQLGICCVYIVFMADNIKKILDPHTDPQLSLLAYMGIIMLPLIIFNMIPNLKALAPFSLLANLLIFAGLIIILYYVTSGRRADLRDKNLPLDLWGSPLSFPLFFGTVLFALTAVGVVVAVENNMKNPKQFSTPCGVLNIGMTIIVAIYVLIGATGYLYCVSECRDSISLDLPQGALATAVMVMYIIAIFISYALQCYVPVEVIFRGYIEPRLQKANASARRVLVAEYVVRIVLCIFTFILAALIPRLGLFISLFGAMCLSALGIIFPVIMETCLAYKPGISTLLIIKNVFLFAVGILGLVVGTYSALAAIVVSFQSKPPPPPTPPEIL